jgi:hypothetical protein
VQLAELGLESWAKRAWVTSRISAERPGPRQERITAAIAAAGISQWGARPGAAPARRRSPGQR